MGEEPGSDLPAPYVSPWSLLRQDLRAVIASLALSLREGLRRNREGGLPRPRFWPQPLAPLFWPVLLLLGLAALLALVLCLARLLPSLSAARSGPTQDPIISPSPPLAMPATPAAPSEVVPGGALLAPSATAAPQPAPAPASEPKEAAVTARTPEPPSPASSQELTLLTRFIRPESEGLLLSVQQDPARFLLSLVVAEPFLALAPARQQHLADDWLEQARLLGYEQLELLDPAGSSLGRSARIGSGMILFTLSAGA